MKIKKEAAMCEKVIELKAPFNNPLVKETMVVTVAVTELLRGDGTEENPHRYVKRFWSTEGALLAENDPVKAKCAECGK